MPVSLGGGASSTWIGTVAGRVDPQGFAEMTPLAISVIDLSFNVDLAVTVTYWQFLHYLHRKSQRKRRRQQYWTHKTPTLRNTRGDYH